MQIIIIRAIDWFFQIMQMLIFIRVILSWLPSLKRNPIVLIIYMLTEPILSPIRRLINKSPLGGPGMMLDLSPLIAMFLIYLASRMLISFVAGIAI